MERIDSGTLIRKEDRPVVFARKYWPTVLKAHPSSFSPGGLIFAAPP